MTGGVIGLAFVFGALLIWFIARRRPRVLALCVAASLVAIASSSAGVAARVSRGHPEYARARALTLLTLPAGYVDKGVKLIHASDTDAPSAVRTWTTTLGLDQTCRDVRTALVSWADHGTVSASTVGRPQCFVSAQWHGHQVDANAGPSGSGITLSVLLAG